MQENWDVSKKQNQAELKTSTSQNSPNELRKDDEFSDSIKAEKKYKDVADAAQAAFESAAYAAAAARAAVELSRSESHDPDDHSGPITGQRKETGRDKPMELESESKIKEINAESKTAESNHNEKVADLERSISSSGSDLPEDDLKVITVSSDEVDSEGSVVSRKQIESSSQASLKVKSGQSSAHATQGSGLGSKQHLDMAMHPMSVRTRFTRQVRGY